MKPALSGLLRFGELQMKTITQMLNDAEQYARSLLETEQCRRAVMAFHGLDKVNLQAKRTGSYRVMRSDRSQIEMPGRLESLLR